MQIKDSVSVKGTNIHIIEPHPDDALGSAWALCVCSEMRVVIHTIADSGDDRRSIDLTARSASRQFVKKHRKYFMPDYDWNDRADKRVPYETALERYYENYGIENIRKLRAILEKIISCVKKEGSCLAIPLGIMHPMHMLVSSLALETAAEKELTQEKVWIYIDHPYDLHSLGTGYLQQSICAAERRLGWKLARYDAFRTEQNDAGELVREIYKDLHHAEFDGAFSRTLCGFCLPEILGDEQKKAAELQKLDVLMIAAQVYPFSGRGGMSNAVYGILKTGQNFMNYAGVIMPWKGEEVSEGTFVERNVFSHTMPNGQRLQCRVESRDFEGIRYHLVWLPGFGDKKEDPLLYVSFAEIILSKIIPMLDYVPNILHCHDWQSAAIPFLLKTLHKNEPFYSQCRTLYTIHFYGYQGICQRSSLNELLQLPPGREMKKAVKKLQYLTPQAQEMASVDVPQLVSLMNAGIHFADCVSTVSEGYAKELQGYPVFRRKVKVKGIRNGISYDTFDPASDAYLTSNYDADTVREKKAENKLALQRKMGWEVNEKIPLLCMVSRLESIKGIDGVILLLPKLMELPLQVIIMGDEAQDGYYSLSLKKIMEQFPEKFCYMPFDSSNETRLYGASDLFLMPSLIESCGTSQMIAMHYGAVPVVSCISALKDSVVPMSEEEMDKGVGYWTYPDDCWMLYEVLVKALSDYKDKDKWNYMVWKCMVTDFSWEHASMKEYALLYHDILEHGEEGAGNGKEC